ncbi:hypothetical protein GCK32_005732 [Trichostrongylus colubriformis]|uniref:Uncharacterized protein n=1 Tax=Trichostrongylus colubriformis TaxID=6319 RepID=A0AAN8FB34_TRICO
MLAFCGGVAAGAVLYHYCSNKKESSPPSQEKEAMKPAKKVDSNREVSVEPGMISSRVTRSSKSSPKESSKAPSSSTNTTAKSPTTASLPTAKLQRSPPAPKSAPTSAPSSRTSSPQRLTPVGSTTSMGQPVPRKAEILTMIQ